MVAGLCQLALKSNRDVYLFDNPNINFYKYAYKTHVNFAIVNIKHEPQTSSTVITSTDIEKDYEFIINNDTTIDFLSNLYFNFTFPDIYSNDIYKFKWVEHAGTLLIKKAGIYYNRDNEIDSITGEWLVIWLELTTPVKDGYNAMTGNIPEMTNPRTKENVYRIRNNIISESDYPIGDKNNNIPSIKKRNVSIPLSFFFTRNSSVALPLLNIYKNINDNISVKITIRPIEELYTIYSDIFNMNISSKYYNTLYKDKISIFTFLKSEFAPNIYIEGTYITIDNNMRNIMQKEINNDYIYQKIHYMDTVYLPTGSIEGTTQVIEIKNNDLPIKEYIWILRREDSILNFNDYCNFTNSIPKNNEDCIMKSASIKWTTINCDRIEERDAFFFNNIQPYQHHSCIPCQGIYCYSFDILPEKWFPSGSANTNDITQKIYIKIGKYNDNLLNTLYKKKFPNSSYEIPKSYKLDLYIIQHNIMKIVNGKIGFIGSTK